MSRPEGQARKIEQSSVWRGLPCPAEDVVTYSTLLSAFAKATLMGNTGFEAWGQGQGSC